MLVPTDVMECMITHLCLGHMTSGDCLLSSYDRRILMSVGFLHNVPYIERCMLMVKCVQSADKEMLITIIHLSLIHGYLQFVGQAVG